MIFEAISDEFRQQLDTISPQFQERLIRSFENQANQLKRYGRPYNYLQDLYFNLANNDKSLVLCQLASRGRAIHYATNMSVNLAKLSIDLNLKVDDLQVEDWYFIEDASLPASMQPPDKTQIKIVYKDVKATGRVGLLIEGDSFVAQNYDVTYQHGDAKIEFKPHVSKHVMRVEEDEIRTAVWTQLVQMLTIALERQLGEAIVDFSVTELMVDEDAELRHFVTEQGKQANKFVDLLLSRVKNRFVWPAYYRESIEMPGFEVTYNFDIDGEVYEGSFKTSNGYIKNISDLSIYKDFSLYQDGQRTEVYGYLQYENGLEHGFESYDSIYGVHKCKGSLNSLMYRSKIFLKLKVRDERDWHQVRLDSFRITMLKDDESRYSDLEGQDWMKHKFDAWVMQNLRSTGKELLEEYMVDVLKGEISNVNFLSCS